MHPCMCAVHSVRVALGGGWVGTRGGACTCVAQPLLCLMYVRAWPAQVRGEDAHSIQQIEAFQVSAAAMEGPPV